MPLSSTDVEHVKNKEKEDVSKAALDLGLITKTVSAIKKWLKTNPSLAEVQQVFDYEVINANRISAVGDEGCLTLILQGE
tara:strand:+ start:1174 stop:1413 length:240 start_codon:yes stop_codon:yes gene_type:complete